MRRAERLLLSLPCVAGGGGGAVVLLQLQRLVRKEVGEPRRFVATAWVL